MRVRLEVRVIAALDEAAASPMQWGTDDCGLFFANVIRDVLGFDPAADWRGKYRTREEAAVVLGALGLGFGALRVAKRHGWKRIDPALALPGDGGLSLFPISATERAITTLICRTSGWFVARNETGFTALSHKYVRLAWAVV